MADDLTITAAGQRLGGWLTTRVTRGCERLPSEFDIALTERHPGQISEIAIKPGDPCRARLGDDPVIRGHVDRLQPSIDARRHALRVQGRGKRADPVRLLRGHRRQRPLHGHGAAHGHAARPGHAPGLPRDWGCETGRGTVRPVIPLR